MDVVQAENFVRTADKTAVDQYFDQLDKSYYNEIPQISDILYEHFLSLYEARFGPRNKIGHVPNSNHYKLPIFMNSLDKITTEDKVNKFTERNPGPYVISDKVDGISGLLELTPSSRKLYNRGTGEVGEDISHILPYLTLPELPLNMLVRGELIIFNSDHDTYFPESVHPRTTVNGLLRGKSTDPSLAKHIKFVTYSIYFPANPEIQLTPSQQFVALQQYGFLVPNPIVSETIVFNQLDALLTDREKNAPYRVDGLVINQDRYYPLTKEKTPKHSVAFKHITETVITTVTEVVWKASKYADLRPTIKTTPVNYQGATLKSFSGKNAKFVVNNGIGVGAVLLVTRGGRSFPKLWKY